MSVSRSSEPDSAHGGSEFHEAGLLLAARAGSNSSLGQLLQQYQNYLSLLADEELGPAIRAKASPSDVVQNSFLEAKRDFEQFTGNTPEEFRAWLRRLLLNNVADVIRSYQGTEKRDILREVQTENLDRRGLDAFEGGVGTPSSIVMKNEQVESLREAIEKLPGHYQDVIRWRNYDRASFEEIGQRLERSAEAARKLWVRAVELLQQELDTSHEADAERSGITIQ